MGIRVFVCYKGEKLLNNEKLVLIECITDLCRKPTALVFLYFRLTLLDTNYPKAPVFSMKLTTMN
jgi:hypothetical protein